MKTQLDRDRIAEEAIGQRRESAPDYAPTKADTSQEEAALQLALSSGAQASIPEKTAESVGERVGDAYSDPARIAQYPKGKVGRLTATAAGSHKRDENNRFLSVGRGGTQERFLTVVAGFALGYVTAVLFSGTHQCLLRYDTGAISNHQASAGRQTSARLRAVNSSQNFNRAPPGHDDSRDHHRARSPGYRSGPD